MKSPWPTKKLGEICEIRTGKKDVDEGNPEGKYPFFTCSREITYSDTYSFDTEAILIAGNGDVGNTKIYKGKFEAYQRTYVLDGFQENIKYIYYYLIGNLKRILVKSKSGSTMPYIRKGDLENFKIPIPPLPIQQKIVKILDTIQSAVEVQERIIEKTKELKKSLMAELFKYGGPSFRKGRKLKKTETLNQSELGAGQVGEIPEDWEVVRLGEVIEIFDSKRIPLSEEERQNMKGPYPYCGANGIIDYINDYIFDGEYVLLAEDGGYWGPLEESSYIMKGKFWVNNHAHIFRALKDKAINFYLMSILNYLNLNDYIGGATRGKLNQSNMRNIKIPLPPLPEQREIAEILQTIDQKIEIEKKKKELYEELFKTMLNKIMGQEIDIGKIEI
jgi:type I restriction enzyme S subunit